MGKAGSNDHIIFMMVAPPFVIVVRLTKTHLLWPNA